MDSSLGLLRFSITGLGLDGAATLTISLPPPWVMVDTYWKYGPTPDDFNYYWYEFL